jgi:hypothetical protein
MNRRANIIKVNLIENEDSECGLHSYTSRYNLVAGSLGYSSEAFGFVKGRKLLKRTVVIA